MVALSQADRRGDSAEQGTAPDLRQLRDSQTCRATMVGAARIPSSLHTHGASWLNMVERFFRDLTQSRLKRGVFRDLKELIMGAETYIDRHNQKPKPFIRTASVRDLLAKITRAHRTLDQGNLLEALH